MQCLSLANTSRYILREGCRDRKPFIQVASANLSIAYACITYLNSSPILLQGSDTDQLTVVVQGFHGLHLYANQFWFKHLLIYLHMQTRSGTKTSEPLLQQLLVLVRFQKDHKMQLGELERFVTPSFNVELRVLDSLPLVKLLVAKTVAFRASLNREEMSIKSAEGRCSSQLSHIPLTTTDIAIGSNQTDPTYFSAVRYNYQRAIETLIGSVASHVFLGIDPPILQSFRETFGFSGFVCRHIRCIRATDGFITKKQRDAHEATHQRKFRCAHTMCEWYSIGFTSRAALSKHNEKYHPVIRDEETLANAFAALKLRQRALVDRQRLHSLNREFGLGMPGTVNSTSNISNESIDRFSPSTNSLAVDSNQTNQQPKQRLTESANSKNRKRPSPTFDMPLSDLLGDYAKGKSSATDITSSIHELPSPFGASNASLETQNKAVGDAVDEAISDGWYRGPNASFSQDLGGQEITETSEGVAIGGLDLLDYMTMNNEQDANLDIEYPLNGGSSSIIEPGIGTASEDVTPPAMSIWDIPESAAASQSFLEDGQRRRPPPLRMADPTSRTTSQYSDTSYNPGFEYFLRDQTKLLISQPTAGPISQMGSGIEPYPQFDKSWSAVVVEDLKARSRESWPDNSDTALSDLKKKLGPNQAEETKIDSGTAEQAEVPKVSGYNDVFDPLHWLLEFPETDVSPEGVSTVALVDGQHEATSQPESMLETSDWYSPYTGETQQIQQQEQIGSLGFSQLPPVPLLAAAQEEADAMRMSLPSLDRIFTPEMTTIQQNSQQNHGDVQGGLQPMGALDHLTPKIASPQDLVATRRISETSRLGESTIKSVRTPGDFINLKNQRLLPVWPPQDEAPHKNSNDHLIAHPSIAALKDQDMDWALSVPSQLGTGDEAWYLPPSWDTP